MYQPVNFEEGGRVNHKYKKSGEIFVSISFSLHVYHMKELIFFQGLLTFLCFRNIVF